MVVTARILFYILLGYAHPDIVGTTDTVGSGTSILEILKWL